MATTFVIACPECEKQVKVSEEHVGKKIRCKGCEHVFTVKAPAASTNSKKEPPEKPKSKGPPPPPPKKDSGAKPEPPKEEPKAAAPKKPYDDDDDTGPKNYGLIAEESTLPRCPFCAKEMASEDAIICMSCGYNTRTRLRPEVKQVHAHTGFEIFLWLLPGISCVIVMIALIVWDLFFMMYIEDWIKDTLQESDGKWVAGLNPGFFKTMMTAFVIVCCYFLGRIAYKRLVVNNKPPEKQIEND